MLKKIQEWIQKPSFMIFLFIIGCLFTLIPILHTCLWFDESYSVSLASHSYQEIWAIDINDVHPPFYYFLLHTLYLIFSNNILVYRLFSWVCLCLLALLGITVIRRDYGSKTALLYTFFIFFLPVLNVYAGEIRMYLLTALLVTVSVLHGLRIARNAYHRSDVILFVIMNILAAYTHYYGLLAVSILNLYLLYVLIKEKRSIKPWLLCALIQIVSYLPWLITFVQQASSVSQNFWISFEFPQTILELFSFQFTGNLQTGTYLNTYIALLFSLVMTVLIAVCVSKKEEKKYTNLFTFGIYLGVILLAILGGIVLHRMILYPRYLLVCTGILILFISDQLARQRKKKILVSILSLTLLVTVIEEFNLYKTNYDASNQAPFIYLNENLKEGDVLIISNADQDPASFVFMTYYPYYQTYYLNICDWNEQSQKAYQAFGDMEIISDVSQLKNLHGRIWITYGDDNGYGEAQTYTADLVASVFDNASMNTKYFKTSYKDLEYTITLIQVN